MAEILKQKSKTIEINGAAKWVSSPGAKIIDKAEKGIFLYTDGEIKNQTAKN
ncbi:MAG: hypothetical protein U5N85_16725 [Arcicella sp.]|nr:hypothetical protein [Arcicella sp.]